MSASRAEGCTTTNAASRCGSQIASAASAQVLVLIGLMAGQAVTTAVLLRLIASGHVVRRDLVPVYPR